MTSRRGIIWAALIASTLWATADMRAADEACSNATIAGAYGFTLSGTNYGRDLPWALVGRLTSNGSGTFTGSGTQSLKGRISKVKFTGQYQVSADCSGSGTLSFANGPSAGFDFTVVDNGREIVLIVADNGTLETGTAKRIRTAASAPRQAPRGGTR